MRVRRTTVAAFLVFSTVAVFAAGSGPDAVRIDWRDLRPPEAAGLPGSSGDLSRSLAWQEPDATVTLTGYLLPVDQEGDLVYEFMLVPWAGACSHTPPPPPNQAVLVIPERPYRAAHIYEHVSVTGRLKPKLEKAQLFILDGVAIVETGYSVGGATVAADADPGSDEPMSNPWKFLRK